MPPPIEIPPAGSGAVLPSQDRAPVSTPVVSAQVEVSVPDSYQPAVSNSSASTPSVGSLAKWVADAELAIKGKALLEVAIDAVPIFLLEDLAKLLAKGDSISFLEKSQQACARFLKTPLEPEKRAEIKYLQAQVTERISEKRQRWIDEKIQQLYQTLAQKINSPANNNRDVQKFHAEVLPQLKKLPSAQRSLYWQKIILAAYEVGDVKSAQSMLTKAFDDIKSRKKGRHALNETFGLVLSLRGHRHATGLTEWFRGVHVKDTLAQDLWDHLPESSDERLEDLIVLRVYYEGLAHEKYQEDDQAQLKKIYQEIKKIQTGFKEKSAHLAKQKVDYSKWVSSAEENPLESPYEEADVSEEPLEVMDQVREEVKLSQGLVKADIAMLSEHAKIPHRQSQVKTQELLANVRQLREDSAMAEDLAALQDESIAEFAASYALAGQALVHYRDEIDEQGDPRFDTRLIEVEVGHTTKQAQKFFRKLVAEQASAKQEASEAKSALALPQELDQAAFDLASRYRWALLDGDLPWLVELNQESITSFAVTSISAHQQIEFAKQSFEPLSNLAYFQAYSQFAALGLDEQAAEVVAHMDQALQSRRLDYEKYSYDPAEELPVELNGDLFGRFKSNAEGYWNAYQKKLAYENFLYDEYVQQTLILTELYRNVGANEKADAVLRRLTAIDGVPDSLRQSRWGSLLTSDDAREHVANLAEGLLQMRQGNAHRAELLLARSAHPFAATMRRELRRRRAEMAVGVLSAIDEEYLKRHHETVMSHLGDSAYAHYQVAMNLGWQAVVDDYAANFDRSLAQSLEATALSERYDNFITGVTPGFDKESRYFSGGLYDHSLNPAVLHYYDSLETDKADGVGYADSIFYLAGTLQDNGYEESAAKLYSHLLHFPNARIQQKARKYLEALPSNASTQGLIGTIYTISGLASIFPQARGVRAGAFALMMLADSQTSRSNIFDVAFDRAELLAPLALGTKTASMATRAYRGWLRAYRGTTALPAIATTGFRYALPHGSALSKAGERLVHHVGMAFGVVPAQAAFHAWKENSTEPFSPTRLAAEAVAFTVDMIGSDLVGLAFSGLNRRIDASIQQKLNDWDLLGNAAAREEAEKLKKLKQFVGYTTMTLGFTGGGYFNEEVGLRESSDVGIFSRLANNFTTAVLMDYAGRFNHAVESRFAPRYRSYRAYVSSYDIDPHSPSGQMLVAHLEGQYQNGLSLKEVLDPTLQKEQQERVRALLDPHFTTLSPGFEGEVLVYSLIPRRARDIGDSTEKVFQDAVDGQYYRRASDKEILEFAAFRHAQAQLKNYEPLVQTYHVMLSKMKASEHYLTSEFEESLSQLNEQLNRLRFMLRERSQFNILSFKNIIFRIASYEDKLNVFIENYERPELSFGDPGRILVTGTAFTGQEGKSSISYALDSAYRVLSGLEEPSLGVAFPQEKNNPSPKHPYRGPVTVALALLGLAAFAGAESEAAVGMMGLWSFLGIGKNKKPQETPLSEIPDRLYIMDLDGSVRSKAVLTAHLSYLLGRILLERGKPQEEVRRELAYQADSINFLSEWLLKGIRMHRWDAQEVVRELFRHLIRDSKGIDKASGLVGKIAPFVLGLKAEEDQARRAEGTVLQVMVADANMTEWTRAHIDRLHRLGPRQDANALAKSLTEDLRGSSIRILDTGPVESASEPVSVLGETKASQRIAVVSHGKSSSTIHDYALVVELDIAGYHHTLLIEADGVGTSSKSYRAARIAVWAAVRYIREHGPDCLPAQIGELLGKAIEAAHRVLASRDFKSADLGATTLALAVIQEEDGHRFLQSAQVGSDSITVYRRGEGGGYAQIYNSKPRPSSSNITEAIGGEDNPNIEINRPLSLRSDDYVIVASDGNPFAREQIELWADEATQGDDPVHFLAAKFGFYDRELKQWFREDKKYEHGASKKAGIQQDDVDRGERRNLSLALNQPRQPVKVDKLTYYLAPNARLYKEAKPPKKEYSAEHEEYFSIYKILEDISDDAQRDALQQTIMELLVQLQSSLTPQQKIDLAGISAEAKSRGDDFAARMTGIHFNSFEGLVLGLGGKIFSSLGREPRGKFRSDDTTAVIWGPPRTGGEEAQDTQVDFNQPGVLSAKPDLESYQSQKAFDSARKNLEASLQEQLRAILNGQVLQHQQVAGKELKPNQPILELKTIRADQNPSILHVELCCRYDFDSTSLGAQKVSYIFNMTLTLDLNSKTVVASQYDAPTTSTKSRSVAKIIDEFCQGIKNRVERLLQSPDNFAGATYEAVPGDKLARHQGMLKASLPSTSRDSGGDALAQALFGRYCFAKMYWDAAGNLVSVKSAQVSKHRVRPGDAFLRLGKDAAAAHLVEVEGYLYDGQLVSQSLARHASQEGDLIDLGLKALQETTLSALGHPVLHDIYEFDLAHDLSKKFLEELHGYERAPRGGDSGEIEIAYEVFDGGKMKPLSFEKAAAAVNRGSPERREARHEKSLGFIKLRIIPGDSGIAQYRFEAEPVSPADRRVLDALVHMYNSSVDWRAQTEAYRREQEKHKDKTRRLVRK